MSTVIGKSPLRTSAEDTTAQRESSLASAEGMSDRFLKLLVAQLKNQDPLNPLDNAQMTSQIAQIQTVGGIERLNGTLRSLMTQYASSQAVQAVSMIGRDVLVRGNALPLEDARPSPFGVELGEASQRLVVAVADANGRVVRTLDLGARAAGIVSLDWDGKNNEGRTMPNGTYQIEACALGQDGEVRQVTALMPGRIRSVINSGGDGGLRFDIGGRLARLDDVRQTL